MAKKRQAGPAAEPPDEGAAITPAYMKSLGFKPDPVLGYVRHLADGHGGIELDLVVGTYPFNEPAVTILVAGFGIVTKAACKGDLEALLRLLDGAALDHPDVMEIDGDLLDGAPEA